MCSSIIKNYYQIKIILNRIYNAAKFGRSTGIVERTVQKWAKRFKDKDWNIFEKQTNKSRGGTSQLQESHNHLISFYDGNPQARVIDAIGSLTTQFEGFNLKKNSVLNFMKKE